MFAFYVLSILLLILIYIILAPLFGIIGGIAIKVIYDFKKNLNEKGEDINE